MFYQLLSVLLAFSQLSQAARVVKLTKTVDNTITNTDVQGPVTVSDWSTSTSTSTTTHYTSTFTSYIFGTPHTYASVVKSTVTSEHPDQETSLSEEQTQTPLTQESQPAPQTLLAQETKPLPAGNTPASSPTSEAPSTSPAPTTSAAPATTAAPVPVSTASPSVVDHVTTADDASSLISGYLLDSVLTLTSSGVCIVNYDYYDTETTETVTQTKTITSTVTV